MSAKKDKIYNAYVSRHNSNHEKQVILSMIWNRKKRKLPLSYSKNVIRETTREITKEY